MKTVKYRDETLSSELEAWAFVMTSWVSLGRSLDNAEPQFHSSPKFYESTISSIIYFFYPQAQACFQTPHCGGCLLHCLTRTEQQSPVGKIVDLSLTPSGLNGRCQVFRHLAPQAINMGQSPGHS